MRLLLALIYIALGAWTYVTLSGGLGSARLPIGFVVCFGLLFSSAFLFNKGLIRTLKRQSRPEYLDELESQGKLIREQFSATRAMHCEDLSTGCAVYFIDVGPSGTILLHGQDYNYEPIDDGEEPVGPREFPTTEFTLLRKAGELEILDLEMTGTIIEPEEFGEPEPQVLYGLGIKLSDGLVFQEPSYESVRSTLMAANNSFKPNLLRSTNNMAG